MERKEVVEKATKLGLEFKKNIPTKKLLAMIEEVSKDEIPTDDPRFPKVRKAKGYLRTDTTHLRKDKSFKGLHPITGQPV